MESKHFSHHHPLVLRHVVPGSECHCSGCKTPAFGNVYVCYYQCKYFLHEQCFRAQRSLKHPSHPLHPLTLVPSPTHPSSSFLCNSCSLSGDGFSYTCSHCDFDLHLHCALNPNTNPYYFTSPVLAQNFSNPTYTPPNSTFTPNQSQITTNNYPPKTAVPNQMNNHHQQQQHNPPPLGYPQFNSNATPQSSTPAADPPPPQPSQINTVKHFSHPHALKELKINDGINATVYLCSACELHLSGSAYRCAEPPCSFRLHKACFDSPREVRHKSHPHHPLTLLPAPPYSSGSFTCDACRKSGKGFAYTCGACSYDLHVDCIRFPDTLTRPDHKHPLALYYEIPGRWGVFTCSACRKTADEKAWVYYCKECDFGTHLECVDSEIKPPQCTASGGEAARIEEERLNFEMQKLKMQLAKDEADFILSLWS